MTLHPEGRGGGIPAGLVPLTYREYRPSPPLRPLVARYSTLVSGTDPNREPWRAGAHGPARLNAGDPLVTALFPNADVNIVIDFGDWLDGGGLDLPGAAGRALAVGAITRPIETRFDKPVALLSVSFRLGRSPGALGHPAQAVTDRAVPLSDLWPDSGSDLVERLRELPSMEARVRFMDRTLRARLSHRPVCQNGLHELIDLVLARPGKLTVAAMSEMAGTTRQTLARRFRVSVGVNPKFFIRLARFHRAVGVLSSNGERGQTDRLARVALELGYYDQSHMSAEFRGLTGRSPGEFVRGR